jgi:hypothetical protein
MISQRDRSLMVDGILVQVTTSLRLPSQFLLLHADDVVGAGPLPLSSVVRSETDNWKQITLRYLRNQLLSYQTMAPHREPESSSNNLPASRAIGKCGKGTPA